MVGLVHVHRRTSGASNTRSSVDESKSDGPDDESTTVEPEQGNVLSHIISQLRPGADLSRVVLPTFILEPRSMLERITNFMAHPETLLPMPEVEDPVQRFVSVVKFYLSGWHIKPPGVKKPLNPILGETYTCYWDFPDGTKGYYISEQTSHHPPKSSYFYMAPEHNIRIDGCLKPRSKFLGNSAASMMEGIAVLRFLGRGKKPGGESYFLTQPNMYARGILFGKMKYELGDHSYVRCPELGLSADIEFKTKGYFGGTYNAVGGFIKNDHTGENLYELSGMWSGEMDLKNLKTGKKDILFDASKSKPTPPQVRPLAEQADRESQKLWLRTAQAVKERNHELATDEKTKIENEQREEAAARAAQGVEWQPKLFRAVRAGPGESEEGEAALDWILDAVIDGVTPQAQTEQILAITPILDGQNASQPMPKVKQNGTFNTPQTQPNQAPNVQAVQPQTNLTHPEPSSTVPMVPMQTIYQQQPVDAAPMQKESQDPNQKHLEHILSATSTSSAQQGPLINFHDDMQKSLSTENNHNTLHRLDTDNRSIDEFVDAQE